MTLFNTAWVKSPKQQDILAERISNQIQTLKKRNLKISIASPYEPNRGEWERAYVRQSGFDLPIEPGTKLIWVSTLTGGTQFFTTIYDLLNGLQSSGAIYPYLENEDYPPIRHIGVNFNGVLHNLYNKPILSGHKAFFDRSNEALRGLEAILYIVKINYGTADVSGLPHGTGLAIATNIDPLRDIALTTNADHVLGVDTRFATGGGGFLITSLTNNVGSITIASISNTSFNLVGSPFAGFNPASLVVIYLNGIAHLISPTTDAIENQRGGASGWSLTTSRVGTASESQLEFTTFQAVNKSVGFSFGEMRSDVVPNSINGNLYGIYNKQTAMELGDSYKWLSQN